MLASALLALGLGPAATHAQAGADQLPIDRWLLSRPLDAGEAIGALTGDPLAVSADSVAFPDRDIEMGPTYWTLARRDGVSRFDLDEWDSAPGDGATWAHVYVRTPEDRSLRLAVEPPSCGTVAGWLNGQPLGAFGPSSPSSRGSAAGERDELGAAARLRPTALPDTAGIRLGAGWNSLLVALTASGCAPVFAVTLLPGDDVEADARRENTMNRLDDIKVQASRPPGIYREHPSSWVTVTGLEGGGDLVWPSGSSDLRGTLGYQVTAWGRDASVSVSPGEGGDSTRPDAPPEIDLTGEWQIQTFTPIGRAVLQAELEMGEDGTLEGELKGRRIGGEISEGWVSGSEFRFVTRLNVRGGRLEIIYRGFADEQSMDGEVSFGQFGEFTSGFQGRRVSGEGIAGEVATDEPAEPEDRPERPAPGDRRGRPPGGDPAGPEESPDIAAAARRAQIRRQLLPPREPRPPAPVSVAVELRATGERHEGTVDGLVPGRPVRGRASLSFDALRRSALEGELVEFRIEWEGGDRRIERPLAADGVLLRLHEPIPLTGWSSPDGGVQTGSWKVPEALGGLTLALRTEGAAGEYSVDGQPLASTGGELLLCSPCRKRSELDLSVVPAGEWTSMPAVIILDPGYPAAAGNPVAPAAEEWLELLGKGDNQRYRELGARFAGSGSDS